jgi:glutaconate CoA-transferase subunit B
LIDAIKGETAMPDAEALGIIKRMDPHNIRATVITDNPPARPV